MREVGRRRAHAAHREVAVLVDRSTVGRPSRRRPPTRWLGVTWAISSGSPVSGDEANASQRAAWRYAGRSPRAAGETARLAHVGVAGARRAVGDEQPGNRSISTRWSEPWAAPRVRRSIESIRSMSPGVPSRTCSTDRERQSGRVPRRNICGVEREAGRAGSGGWPSGPCEALNIPRRQPRRGTQRRLDQRPARCPVPAAPDRTANDARIHISSRRERRREADHRDRPARPPRTRPGQCPAGARCAAIQDS